MRIIIEADIDKVTSIAIEEAEEGQATYENLTAILFCIIENFTKQVLDEHPDDMNEIWDYVAGACDRLCIKLFPEPDSKFELSDAAIIYAEDQIIKRAEKKGISFEEALAQYEEKAQKYVAERSGVLN